MENFGTKLILKQQTLKLGTCHLWNVKLEGTLTFFCIMNVVNITLFILEIANK